MPPSLSVRIRELSVLTLDCVAATYLAFFALVLHTGWAHDQAPYRCATQHARISFASVAGMYYTWKPRTKPNFDGRTAPALLTIPVECRGSTIVYASAGESVP
jgi:hypothetical protein